jgi:U3 small nucleolar RNA-associated protein 20
LDQDCSQSLSQLICYIWKNKTLPPNNNNNNNNKLHHSPPYFVKSITPWLSPLFHELIGKQQESLAIFLIRNLIPTLSPDISSIGPVILSAVAATASAPNHSKDDDDDDALLEWIHAMIIVREETLVEETDQVFFMERAKYCMLSDNVQVDNILYLCGMNDPVDDAFITIDNSTKICTRVRVAVFVASLTTIDDDATDGVTTAVNKNDIAKNQREKSMRFKRVFQWLGKILEKGIRPSIPWEPHQIIIIACTLEAFSDLARVAIGQCQNSSWFNTGLKRAGELAESFLLVNPSSLVALKSVASFIKIYELAEFRWTGENHMHEIFDALIPNLRHKSHFLRLRSLEILASFPKRPFVINHADLDLADDLDDEQTPNLPSITSTKSSMDYGPTGTCNLLDTLLFVEKTCASLLTERELASALSTIGVLGRSGRLPVAYAEAAANHLLGILNIKFSSLWKPSISALISLAIGHEDCVWPSLHEHIASVTNEYPYRKGNETSTTTELSPLWSIDEFYSLLSDWEISSGADSSLFAFDKAHSVEQGRVSWHSCTDNTALFESLWNVVESAPTLLTAHSRQLVSVFINFMHFQYFVVHLDDPDARELCLKDHLMDASESKQPPNDLHLDAAAIEKRLLFILKAYSAASGPKQLVKHELLLAIFISLLAHRDNQISLSALSCVLKYKLPYLSSYSDSLKMIYEKGKFRDALMHLKTALESDELRPEDRPSFINLLSRILFGRLSVRSTGAKSTKDSPSARRGTVLSFLSSLCKDDEEFFHFIYLALRAFVPSNCDVSSVDWHSPVHMSKILSSLCSISTEDCAKLPQQVHQGFLNLLESIISQLGRKVAMFVPAFLSILFSISKLYQVKVAVENNNRDGATERTERHGTIRSLCYRRIAEILLLVIDEPNIDVSMYSATLWDSMQGSLSLLPEMACSSENVPSILHLIRTLSSEKQLLKILKENSRVVPLVLKCLSEHSKIAVVDEVLSFIENLMNLDDDRNHNLLQPHIGLMLNQFKIRFTSANSIHVQKNIQTWRRELDILCRVCEMMELYSEHNPADSNVFDNLSTLLIPFLGQGRFISDADRLHVLEVLLKITSRIHDEKLIKNHYDALSSLLAPSKTIGGQLSRETRKSIACVLDKLTKRYQPAKLVTSTLLRLCCISSIRVDELDYDKVIPALNSLANPLDSSCWSNLCMFQSKTYPSVLSPLIQMCFYLFFDGDGVVVRGSFKALKSLILFASGKLQTCCDSDPTSEETQAWKKILEGCIVSQTRSGIAYTREDDTRKFFVLLLRDIAICNKSTSSPNLYGDLACLTQDDEPDLDFFLSITHVQIHRRVRALRRLRKLLECNENAPALSAQSLSNILLPLSLHPIYETVKNIEDSYALEGIATAGTICGRLSWKKYSDTLWTHLAQFERHPDREKYIVGLICSIIDGFHFKSTDENEDAVLRSMENRFFPKLESLLIKEKKDKTGRKIKLLRSTVVLALLKLIHKLPKVLFESKLPRLLAIICDALRDRDSDAREVARTTLVKIVLEIDLIYLSKILHELATSLTEGYKLHVRTATIHSILLGLSSMYQPPETWNGTPTVPPFDSNVPILVDLLQQDLFGEAQERKDADGSKVSFVKEAGGSKSTHTLELIAGMIYFRSSQTLELSGVHSLVSPFLERLHSPTTSIQEAKRIKECLNRIATGLLKNPSLKANDAVAFVKTLLMPFSTEQDSDPMDSCTEVDSDDDIVDSSKPIKISGGRSIDTFDNPKAQKSQVIDWRPSMVHSSKTSGEAYFAKKKEEHAISKVLDGSNAPKLTGSSRAVPQSFPAEIDVNNSSAVTIEVFGLHLLASTLKRADKNIADVALLNSIVPILSSCFCHCRNTEVVLLSMKCLGCLLAAEISTLKRCYKDLAAKTLNLLVEAGTNQELLQAAFKMLTALISFDRSGPSTGSQLNKSMIDQGGSALFANESIPLDSEQMQVLISFLQESVLNSVHHQPAIALIKAITAKRFISAELYDLMEKLLELSVRSLKSSLRDQCGSIFVRYLINYPLSEERLEQHLKQIVLNLSYEFSEGRVSSISLLKSVIEKLPAVLVNKHCQLFFIPLTLRIANENCDDCRAAVTKCLGKLVQVVSTDVIESLFEYTERWSSRDGTLRRVSLQIFGVFVEERLDFIKRGDNVTKIMNVVESVLDDDETAVDWEVQYFALLLIEKMSPTFGDMLSERVELWQKVVVAMTKSHPWIRLVSCRLLCTYLTALDPLDFVPNHNKMSFLVQWPKSLHHISRNLCLQLSMDKEEPSDQIITIVAKTLTWLIRAMKEHPELCFDVDDDEGENKDRDPVKWVFMRLSNIARPKVAARRIAVYKCFAAFAQYCENIPFYYLELMLEPLCRSETESKNESGSTMFGSASLSEPILSEEGNITKDVLCLLEEKCDPPETFFQALSAIKRRAREKKEQRKMEEKTRFITDPETAAQRRIQKHEHEKNRRKRRIEDQRSNRGAAKSKR